MFTILGADGKEYGPVTAEKIVEWIQGGRANAHTKARRDGDTEWNALGDFPEFSHANIPAASPARAPLVPVPPANGTTGASDYNPLTVDAKTYAEDLLSRAQPLDVFGCLSRSFELWKNNLLPLVGATTVVALIMMVMSFVPFLGSIASIVLTGVFYGGLYYYYLGKMRGQPRVFGDVFSGFSRGFGPLMIASVLVAVISMVIAAIFMGPVLFSIMASAKNGSPNLTLAPLLFLCAIPVIFIQISWMFSFPLIIDKGLTAWTAMEVSRRVIMRYWFRMFFVVILGSILAALGLIGFFIGVFFTLPLLIGAVLYAYEDLCNAPPRA
jgi:hypothetical protein